MQLIQVMQDVFNRPPAPFNPANQTLKGWVMFCLRDRGFMVTPAQNADFSITTKGEKFSFKVSESADNLDPSVGWVVVDRSAQTATVIAPHP
ncbi:hypothetical protein [Myxacorys almedinensis]|uniref:Uncharacterized protein n=1 Tax=Myxacorys almedinensis A TaxID=2690445 RepID=A0A8J7Z4K8_9CYAN|nr:hypothetical protein [Myxacorys almedinensis]NDJ16333.1 hypothetical protein [Myxacorys almedinensis A]